MNSAYPSDVTSSVLVVDDDPDISITLQDLLEGEGHKVEVARTGAEALNRIAKKDFGAVLLDVGLPDKDGLAVLQEIVQAKPHLSVIILSAYTTLEKTIGPVDLQGAQGFLTKPFNREELKAAIRKAVNRTELAGRADRAHRALIGSENRFRSVVESCPDAIILANALGWITGWNKAAERLFGYREEEVVGKPLTLLMPHGYREAHQAGLERLARTGESRVVGKTIELSGLRKNGEIFPAELSLGCWESGTERCFCGTIRDLSERKRIEEEKHRACREFEALLRHLPMPLVIAGNHGEIRFANPAFEEMIGGEGEKILGQHALGLLGVDPGQWETLIPRVHGSESLSEEGAGEGCLTIRGRTHRYRFFPLFRDGNQSGNVGMVFWTIEERLI